jgi:hypothetical protein
MLLILVLIIQMSCFYGWTHVKEITTGDEVSCAIECQVDSKCSSWTFAKHKIAIHSNKCYLQSQLFDDNKKNLISSLLPSKVHVMSGNASSNIMQYNRLLTGPIAIGRTTIMNAPQSFYFGCSYTVMLWVWLWKPTKLPHQHEMAIFSTRDSLPISAKHQSLLPSVIFNIVSQPDLMFYSTMKDPRGDWEGMWGQPVEFNKWMHITLTFQADVMTVYLNGIPHEKPLTLRKKEGFSSHKCPGKLSAYDDTPLSSDSTHQPWSHALENNTIFQIGGTTVGNMAGILQNIDVFNGVALTSSTIRRWMDSHPHAHFPTLDYLYGLTYQDMVSSPSIDSIKANDYAMLSMGYCPGSVCGEICVDGEESGEVDASDMDVELIDGSRDIDSVDYSDDADEGTEVELLDSALYTSEDANSGDISETEKSLDDGSDAEAAAVASDSSITPVHVADPANPDDSDHTDDDFTGSDFELDEARPTGWKALVKHMQQEDFDPYMDEVEFQDLLGKFKIDPDISDDDLIKLWQEGIGNYDPDSPYDSYSTAYDGYSQGYGDSYGDGVGGSRGGGYEGVESFEQLKHILKMNGMEGLHTDEELLAIWDEGVLTGELKIDIPAEHGGGLDGFFDGEYDDFYSGGAASKEVQNERDKKHQQFTHTRKQGGDASKSPKNRKETQAQAQSYSQTQNQNYDRVQTRNQVPKSRAYGVGEMEEEEEEGTSNSQGEGEPSSSKGLFHEDHFGNPVPVSDSLRGQGSSEGEETEASVDGSVESVLVDSTGDVASKTAAAVEKGPKKTERADKQAHVPHKAPQPPTAAPVPWTPLPPREFKALLELQLRDPYSRQSTHAKALHDKGEYANAYGDAKSADNEGAYSAKETGGSGSGVDGSWAAEGSIFAPLAPFFSWGRQVFDAQRHFENAKHGIFSFAQSVAKQLGVNTTVFDLSTNDTETSELDAKIDAAMNTILSKYGSKKQQLGEEGLKLLRTQIAEYVTLYADSGIDFLQEIADSNVVIAESGSTDPRVDRINFLYDQALLWMTGRHMVYAYSAVAPHVHVSDKDSDTDSGDTSSVMSPHSAGRELSPSGDVAYSDVISVYRKSSLEPSQSALMMAMWLTDELEAEYPILVSGAWFSKAYSSMLGQPIRLALGFRHARDVYTDVHVREDVNYYVDRILKQSAEKLALGVAEGEADDADNSLNKPSHTATSAIAATENTAEGGTEKVSSDAINGHATIRKNDINWLAVIAQVDHELPSSGSLNHPSLQPLLGASSHHPDSSYSPSYTSDNSLAATSSTPATSSSNFADLNRGECSVAASYYLPVANYVNAYFGAVETGVNTPENIRLSDLPSLENILGGASSVAGTGDTSQAERQMASSATDSAGSMRQLYEAEAAAGNVEAQVWMGIQSYWGTQGVPLNATAARKYFEKASAKNNSEALYCLGAMYDNGQGGLPRNKTKAIELFKLSAAQKVPWPAALQTLGTYYMSSSVLVRSL